MHEETPLKKISKRERIPDVYRERLYRHALTSDGGSEATLLSSLRSDRFASLKVIE